MSIRALSFIMLSVLMMISCQSEAQPSPKNASSKDIDTIEHGANKAAAKKALAPIFEKYFVLKDALVRDEHKNAQAASKEMASALKGVKMAAFSGQARELWMEHNVALEQALTKAGQSNEISQIRASFKNISDRMITLIKAFGRIDQPVFVEYCPMADDNKGAAWLSTEKQIMNPYFGASMLNCGVVKEEI